MNVDRTFLESEPGYEPVYQIAPEIVEADNGYFIPKVAADILGVTTGTLQRWRRRGEGPKAHVRGGQVYYEAKEIIYRAYYAYGIGRPTKKAAWNL